jgi:hypothetical protein
MQVHDGMRASRCKRKLAFKHNSVSSLTTVLRKLRPDATKGPQTIFVAVETLYSMDGDLCPLPEMLKLVEQHHNVYLIVDEVCLLSARSRRSSRSSGALHGPLWHSGQRLALALWTATSLARLDPPAHLREGVIVLRRCAMRSCTLVRLIR